MRIQGNKGGSSSGHTPVESPDNLLSTSTAKILLALCEGEIAGGLDDTRIFLDGTPIGNADGSKNFEGVTWEFRPGSQHQEYIKGLPSVENDIAVGAELKYNSAYVRSISNTQLSAVRLRLSVPQFIEQKDNGDTVGYRVEYAIDLSTDGGGFQEVLTSAFDGKTTSEYQRSHRINLPTALTGWQIRVRRLTPENSSIKVVDNINIASMTEVIDAKLRYPNTALLFITFDAKQFSNGIPKISVRPKGGSIIRVPSNYDPESRTYIGVWDGTFKLAATNNPAWVFYDLVINNRYACGDHIDASQIDKWELYRIAQYCDELIPDGRGGSGVEPRFLCDVYIQSQESAYQVLRDIATIFRGMSYWADNQVKVVADMPADVFRVFTNANMVGGKANYQGGSQQNRYTHALVAYSDTNNHGKDTIEPVADIELQRRYGVRKLEITAIGCTRQTEANRRGRWVILTNAKDRTISFSTGLEGAIPSPGHIIGVADTNLAGRKIGGRISSVKGRNITLDRVADVKTGDRLIINLKNGKSEARTVQNVNEKVITVTTAYSGDIDNGAVWTVDADDLAIQLYRVTNIDVGDKNTYVINGVYHNADKYNHIDTGARVDERPITVIPPNVQPAPKNVSISSNFVVNQGIAVTTLLVQWDVASDAIAYEAEWRRDNNNWVSVSRTSSLGFEVSGIYSGRYQARVRAINASDISSQWAYAPEKVLNGKEGNPPAPLGFKSTSLIFGIQLSWGFDIDTEDTLKTEIQYGKTSNTGEFILLADVPYPAKSHELIGIDPGTLLYFRARLVDKTGNQSEWTPVIEGKASDDIPGMIEAVDNAIKESGAFENLKNGIDSNLEAILNNALATDSAVSNQWKQFGEVRADVITIRKTVVNTEQSMAELTEIVQAQYDDVISAVNQKMTAEVTSDGDAKAYYTLNLGVIRNDKKYNSGMTIGIEPDNSGDYKSTVVFAADRFGIYAGSNPDDYQPAFLIDGGKTFINNTFIKDASITSAKIANASITAAKISNYIQSDDYIANQKGMKLSFRTGAIEINSSTTGSGRVSLDATGLSAFDSNNVRRVKLGKIR